MAPVDRSARVLQPGLAKFEKRRVAAIRGGALTAAQTSSDDSQGRRRSGEFPLQYLCSSNNGVYERTLTVSQQSAWRGANRQPISLDWRDLGNAASDHGADYATHVG